MLYRRMRRAGLLANSARGVLLEALTLDTGEALEAAMIGSLCAMSQIARNEKLDDESKKLLFQSVCSTEEYQRVRKRWNQIQHEGA